MTSRQASQIHEVLTAAILIDAAGKIAAFGAAAEALLGHVADDMTGQPFDALVPASMNGGTDGFALLQGAADERQPRRTVSVQAKTGDTLTVDLVADRLKLDGRSFYVAVFSLPYAAELLKTDAGDAMPKSSATALAAGIAHDVNNLLWLISGSLELLGSEPPPANGRELIADAVAAVDEAAEMLARLSVAAGEASARPTRLDLNNEVGSAIGKLTRAMGTTIAPLTHLAPELPMVMADRATLQKALMALVLLMHDTAPLDAGLAVETRRRTISPRDAADIVGAWPGDFAVVTVREQKDCDGDETIAERPQGAVRGSPPDKAPRLSVVPPLAQRCGGFLEVVECPCGCRSYSLWLPVDPAGS